MDVSLLQKLYYEMLRIRIVEEVIAEQYDPSQAMRCPVHLCVGQEAVAVGVCANLTREDYVLSGHRSHGHYLAKGGSLAAMMAELYGKATGCSHGKGGSMHLVDLSVGFLGATPIVGSTIPIAVGAALGSTMRGEDRVTVAFFGDAATEEGVFHESLNFAALRKLPVVFVCENNLYSVNSPMGVRRPAGREIARLAEGQGVASHQGDGNDVLEVYELARKGISGARKGEGPVFLEFKTYRWREHCGPRYDHDRGYRPGEEVSDWMRRCPLDRLGEQLVGEGAVTQDELAGMTQAIQREMQEAVDYAQGAPFPEGCCLLADVYAP